jgi:hypothetical protein
MDTTALAKTLAGVPKDDYGEEYDKHLFELYRICLEMADRISTRREKANSFFLTLNTGVVGFVGYVAGTEKLGTNDWWLAFLAVAGITLSYLWFRILKSFRGLNSAKFQVLQEMERRLPLRPYAAEWAAVGYGKRGDLYLPFTHIEMLVPWVFLGLHGLALLRVLFG